MKNKNIQIEKNGDNSYSVTVNGEKLQEKYGEVNFPIKILESLELKDLEQLSSFYVDLDSNKGMAKYPAFKNLLLDLNLYKTKGYIGVHLNMYPPYVSKFGYDDIYQCKMPKILSRYRNVKIFHHPIKDFDKYDRDVLNGLALKFFISQLKIIKHY